MPLYEFRCETCGDFEVWRRMAEVGNPVHCPTCEAIARRLYSAPSVNLNSGSLSTLSGSSEPRVMKRETEPSQPRYQAAQGSRPWMVSHSPPRY